MEKNFCVSFYDCGCRQRLEPMSESVVVNFVANALWQLHRFLQLCLRHRRKLVEVLLSRSSHSAKSGYLTARQSWDEEGREM